MCDTDYLTKLYHLLMISLSRLLGRSDGVKASTLHGMKETYDSIITISAGRK